MNEGNGLPRPVRPGPRAARLVGALVWGQGAEPDVGAASELMRHVFEHRDEAGAAGASGRGPASCGSSRSSGRRSHLRPPGRAGREAPVSRAPRSEGVADVGDRRRRVSVGRPRTGAELRPSARRTNALASRRGPAPVRLRRPRRLHRLERSSTQAPSTRGTRLGPRTAGADALRARRGVTVKCGRGLAPRSSRRARGAGGRSRRPRRAAARGASRPGP